MANGQYGNMGRGNRGGYGDYYGYGRQNPYARGYHSGIKPQFVDYGKVISNRIAPGIQRLYLERKAKEEQHIKNIDNMAVGPDYLKVQNEWQPGVEQQVALEHTAYLEGARLMKKHRAGSKEYMQGQQMLKGAQTNLQNLDKIFTLHQTHRKTFDENLKAGKYSEANLNAQQSNWLETMTTPWENMSFEGGRIIYKGMGENGEDINFSDLEKPFLKAEGLMTDVLKQLDDNINLAKQGKGKILNAKTGEMEWNTQLSDYYLGNLFSNSSTQDMQSVAYDLKFENPDPNVTEQLSFATAYGIGNDQDLSQLSDIQKEKYKIQEDYQAGKLGGDPEKYETWAKDPELRGKLQSEMTKFFTDSFKGAAEQQYVQPMVNPGDISDREKNDRKMVLDYLKAGYDYNPKTGEYTKIEGSSDEGGRDYYKYLTSNVPKSPKGQIWGVEGIDKKFDRININALQNRIQGMSEGGKTGIDLNIVRSDISEAHLAKPATEGVGSGYKGLMPGDIVEVVVDAPGSATITIPKKGVNESDAAFQARIVEAGSKETKKSNTIKVPYDGDYDSFMITLASALKGTDLDFVDQEYISNASGKASGL